MIFNNQTTRFFLLINKTKILQVSLLLPLLILFLIFGQIGVSNSKENDLSDISLTLKSIQQSDLDLLAISENSILKYKSIEEALHYRLPKDVRRKAKKYISPVIYFSNIHDVDPYWVISIMWTESHFKKNARSHKGAFGLMQLMPDTLKYVENIGLNKRILRNRVELNKLSKKYNISNKELRNIELGVVYLKYLINKFDNNLIHATVAYNMGPTRIKSWLKNGRPVGKKNKYLNKIQNAYNRLAPESK